MRKKVLVLNMGMKSIRSIIFDQKGNKLASASQPLSTSLNEKFVTQDPSEWWTCAKKVIRATLKDIGYQAVDYITVTSSASCLVYVDEYSDALAPCIMVSDKRADSECAEIKKLESKMPGNGKSSISAGPMLGRILWVKRNQPEKYNATVKFLSPNDFLIGKLTGKFVIDPLNAMKICYDPEQKSYNKALLDKLGIDISKLPDIAEIGSILGNVKSEAAKELNINESCEVILTTYDAICSFFGSGVAKEGDASDVSGTVTVLRALSYKDNLKDSDDIFTMPYAKKGCSIVGGSNNLGGGLIEWIKQCYYIGERHPYELMECEAGESTLGADGLIFIPYLLGERAPIWDSTVRGMFFGIERYHTRKDMTRAVFESTGFIDMDFISAIEKTGMKIKSIRVSGGLARINLVNQIKADITGKEIKVLNDFETTASGAAMMAFEGAGVFSDMKKAADMFSDVRMVIKPDYQSHVKYQKIYGLYKQIYAETKNLFASREKIFSQIYSTRECTIENM